MREVLSAKVVATEMDRLMVDWRCYFSFREINFIILCEVNSPNYLARN